MLISAKAIRKPRTFVLCDQCGESIYGPHLRLYGAAHEGDRPYVIRLHPDCTQWEDPKILAAKLARAGTQGER